MTEEAIRRNEARAEGRAEGFARGVEQAAQVAQSEVDRMLKLAERQPASMSNARTATHVREKIRRLQPDPSLVVVKREEIEKAKRHLAFEKGRIHDLYAAIALLDAMLGKP